jgi:hypothetical protein
MDESPPPVRSTTWTLCKQSFQSATILRTQPYCGRCFFSLSCQESLHSLCVLLKPVIGVVSWRAIRMRGEACLSAVRILIDVRNNFTPVDMLIKLVKVCLSQGLSLACRYVRRRFCVVCLVRNLFHVLNEEQDQKVPNFVFDLNRKI